MAGTTAGGKQAAETNIKRYGIDFYREIGRKGGQKSRDGGFAKNRELARKAGRLRGLAKKSNRRSE